MLIQRPRRLRGTALMRDAVAETTVSAKRLVMPHFVCEGSGVREPIGAMPGIDRVSIDNLARDVERDHACGVDAIILFGIPAVKDEKASQAYAADGIVQRAVREIKRAAPGVLVITDVCLCEYMSHGHCGVVRDGVIVNDASCELIAKTALSHAQAGADIVAPSDMMDGRVAAIRTTLDACGRCDTPILSYAVKYASAFYGPFREAAGSAPHFGDRRSYQMDFRNAREAEKEARLDVDEGADIVMVKPALAYLDIVRRVREAVSVPVCAYNVSGEYSMVKAAAAAGCVDERSIVIEILTAIVRAGADMVITYHARDIARERWL